jgi:NAD(P)H dehydrogenase (quinone)
MGKRILIINGHPYKESLNFALAEAYKKGATESGAEIKDINIADLQFNPNCSMVTGNARNWNRIY